MKTTGANMLLEDVNNLTQDELALYVRIANYYYRGYLTQNEIATRLRMSRQRVNRILSKCMSLGIVEIRIKNDVSAYLEMETALEEKYKLRAVRVAGLATDDEDSFQLIGECGARFLAETIQDNDIIGFSRGSTLSALVAGMPPVKRQNLMVTQLMGGWNNHINNVDGDSIVIRFGEQTAAKINMLYAPVLVSDPSVRDNILQEPHYQTSYAVMKSCTIAVLGIADIRHANFPSLEQLNLAMPATATGEICARPFDACGKPVSTSFDRQIIAIETDDLKRIPLRIGVAGMPHKTEAILGAIRGGYINALVTDVTVASALLDK